MYVENLESPRSGEPVKNQFAIYCTDSKSRNVICFQSYKTLIAIKDIATKTVRVHERLRHYSRTTAKYLNVFLNDYCCDSQVVEVKDLDD